MQAIQFIQRWKIPPNPIPLCLLSSNWMPHPSNRRFELQVGKAAVLKSMAVYVRSPLIDPIKNQATKCLPHRDYLYQ